MQKVQKQIKIKDVKKAAKTLKQSKAAKNVRITAEMLLNLTDTNM